MSSNDLQTTATDTSRLTSTLASPGLVTVFGAGGFIGRYVVQELAKRGARIRAAVRVPHEAFYLKPLAGLGQLDIARADVTHEGSVRAACEGADAVVNLVGILDGDFESVQLGGSRNVADAAADVGARRFVQISAIGADAGSEIAYQRTKGLAEGHVREVMPSATILRPSIVFGPEDEFLNRFATMMRALPKMLLVAADARFQPVYVADLAEAIARAATDNIANGQTLEMGGPAEVTMRDLFHYIARTIGADENFIELPDFIVGRVAKAVGWLPGAPMTHDQWQMLQQPNVVTGENGLAVFGIDPTPMQAVASAWLTRYRTQGRFTKAA
ncbi:MAG: complex I NDUFA9 subunit family protein [Pacificimonas sp.]